MEERSQRRIQRRKVRYMTVEYKYSCNVGKLVLETIRQFNEYVNGCKAN